MLQRGLLTNAEQQQQQQQPPYETSARATQEINLLKEQEHLSNKRNSSSNREVTNEQLRERINCLPIIEMPQIKIEQDVEYMEGIEEDEQEQQQQQELLNREEEEEEMRDETQPMELEQEELHIKPMPQLLEPTSILKTSLLTGAANTLATLTAAAEQIARMPNESLTKNYPYFKEENKRTYTVEAEEPVSKETTTTTYTSILQTALMSKRPATLNVAAATTSSGLTASKTLHVRTPDQVLKTAVTLATLSEIAAQQEQQQQLQQQQQQQQQQQSHILVVPQVQPTLRKMCTLPFKKLNFANVTTSSSTATCLTNTASLNSTTTTTTAAAAATATTTTTITNNYLGSNLKTNTNLTNSSSCIINTNNQAASNNIEKTTTTPTTTTTATFFDTNKLINNITICNNSNNSNLTTNFNTNLKIPSIKPHLVTTQTQTEETNTTINNTNNNNCASSLQTASCSGLLRTAVSTTMKMLTQNSLNTSLTSRFSSKTKQQETANLAETVVGNIIKHNSPNSGSSCSSSSSGSMGTSLTKMNVIKTKTTTNPLTNTLELTNEQNNAVDNSNNTATNVTVVVFETLLPED